MRIAIFAAFLLVALGYAAWRGGAPERTMVGIAVTIVIWDRMLVTFGTVVYHSVDVGYLALDIFGASSTFILAMVAHRFWPMIAAPLHSLPLLAHFSRAVDVQMDPVAYLTMQVATSWVLPPLLIAATWRHQKRLTKNGSDPAWRSSSKLSRQRTATS
ncbi:hypothetical protein [uncultured Sphingopyxis sp.]|jgi:hypothetical protein|uniref:hypothetical protein n=1 Tax=uncultured Sphingopyxis sp. TaxID=310581 RepID=UPI000AF168AC|nr:hypothetical protein [uncultured Sphingopyxis sp.]